MVYTRRGSCLRISLRCLCTCCCCCCCRCTGDYVRSLQSSDRHRVISRHSAVSGRRQPARRQHGHPLVSLRLPAGFVSLTHEKLLLRNSLRHTFVNWLSVAIVKRRYARLQPLFEADTTTQYACGTNRDAYTGLDGSPRKCFKFRFRKSRNFERFGP